jgi:formylmethanofuran dehydrogenase subunit E
MLFSVTEITLIMAAQCGFNPSGNEGLLFGEIQQFHIKFLFISCLSDVHTLFCMQAGTHRYSYQELDARMIACGVGPDLRKMIHSTAEFHSYPAPGVLIGAFMVDYALELLGANPGLKLYTVCETPKCAPDAVQAIAHCTTGNNRLRVLPIGKFAITMNAACETPTADAVRVYVDLNKLKKFKIIDIWYANSPAFEKATMRELLQEEIFRAGRDILSWERVRVGTSTKRKWQSVTCPGCGETVPDYLVEGDHCAACGSLKYYEKIPC